MRHGDEFNKIETISQALNPGEAVVIVINEKKMFMIYGDPKSVEVEVEDLEKLKVGAENVYGCNKVAIVTHRGTGELTNRIISF